MRPAKLCLLCGRTVLSILHFNSFILKLILCSVVTIIVLIILYRMVLKEPTGPHERDHQSVQSLSHVQLFATPWTAAHQAFPVHHQLLEFTQTHVHWVGDAIQPSHPLLSPSPAFSLSEHQGLFQLVSFLHQVARVLEFQLQHQSFQ